MNDNRGAFTKIYFGVPRFVGEWFRATKIPSLLLLLGLLVVPLALSIYTVVYARLYRSTLPMNLFFAGATQFKIEHDPTAAQNLPPHLAELMRTMTPEQKQFGKLVFQCYLVLMFVLAGACIWWIIATLKFLTKKLPQRAP